MKCLVVGGTGFLGGAIADALNSAGHDTTILSRGKTLRTQAENIETLCADRYGDLTELAGRDFDWIFDSCAYTPDAVHKLLDAAGAGLKRYVLISSISAYGTFEKRGLTEDDLAPEASSEDFAIAQAVPATDRSSTFAYGGSYGPLKRACEIAAAERLGTCATSLRVGLLVGVGDYSDRLTWWVRRIDEASGERPRVPVPGPANRYVQLIDVHDVAAFALRSAENTLGGIWNITGTPMPLVDVLNEVIRTSESQAEINTVEEKSILKSGIEPWTEIPLMAPIAPEYRYFMEVDTTRANLAGLHCRSLEMTLRPLLAWDRSRRNLPLKGGMTPQQEYLLLT